MATPTAHTEQSTPHKGVFPPFNPETFASQAFWLVICFAFLFVMMWKVALPRIGAIIENREKRIADDLAAAGNARAESDAAVAAYEQALADARAGAQVIANEMREKQAAETETARKRIEGELNTRLAAAETSITATKQAAMANVRGIAADATRAIVEKLTGIAPADAAVDAAITETLKG
jgi:F-type H+-transporting ATPase subunit b